MDAYLHSVDRTVEQALQRAPLHLALEGRIDFTRDGRMTAKMQNTNTVQMDFFGGMAAVIITPGDVQVRASSGALGR
jgi:hypothetical protein